MTVWSSCDTDSGIGQAKLAESFSSLSRQSPNIRFFSIEYWPPHESQLRSRRFLGLAGESRKAKLLYLALASRLLAKPVSVSLKGPSSAGKSHLVQRVLEHFPPEAFYFVTAMSGRALAYSEEPLKHRFIVLAEAAALAGDFLNYLMRSLLSEGRLSYETVDKEGGKLSARRSEPCC